MAPHGLGVVPGPGVPVGNVLAVYKRHRYIINKKKICKTNVNFFHVSPLELSRGRVEIPSTGLTLPHFCACPKSGPRFPI